MNLKPYNIFKLALNLTLLSLVGCGGGGGGDGGKTNASTSSSSIMSAIPKITSLMRIGDDPLVLGTVIKVSATCTNCDPNKITYEWTSDGEALTTGDSFTITEQTKTKLITLKATAYSSAGGTATISFQRDQFVEIISNGQASVALTNKGELTAWGFVSLGGLAPAEAKSNIKKVFPINSRNMTGFVAVKADDTLISWGQDETNQARLQINTATNPKLTQVQEIVLSGRDAWAALKADKTVVVGGNPITGGKAEGVDLSNIAKVFALDAGFVALKTDGTLVSWGQADCVDKVPKGLTSIKKVVVQPSARECSGTALKTDGSVVVWNESWYPTLPDLNQLTQVVDIVPGGHAFAAIKENGEVITWGGFKDLPLEPLTDVVEVLGNYNGFVARKKDGSASFWAGGYNAEIIGTWEDLISIKKVQQGFLGLRKDGTLVAYGDLGEFAGIESIKDVVSIPDQPQATYRFVVQKAENKKVQFGGLVSQPDTENLNNIQSLVSGWDFWSAIKEDGSLYRWGNNFDFTPYKDGQLTPINSHGGVRKSGNTFLLYEDNTLIEYGEPQKITAEVADFALVNGGESGVSGTALLDTSGKLIFDYQVFNHTTKQSTVSHTEVMNVKSILAGGYESGRTYYTLLNGSVWSYDGLQTKQVFSNAKELITFPSAILFAVKADGTVTYDDPNKNGDSNLFDKINQLTNVAHLYSPYIAEKTDRSLEYFGNATPDFYFPEQLITQIKQIETIDSGVFAVITNDNKLKLFGTNSPYIGSSLLNKGESISSLYSRDLSAKRILKMQGIANTDGLLIQMMDDHWEYIGQYADDWETINGLKMLNNRPNDIDQIISGSDWANGNWANFAIMYKDGSAGLFDYNGILWGSQAYADIFKDVTKIEKDSNLDMWFVYLKNGSVIPVHSSGLNLIPDNIAPKDLISDVIYSD